MTNQFPDATKMVFPPNDLSHLSDEEFNALAPQGYHATGPAEPLSPAAQAVVDAYNSRWDNDLAAALRAAADAVAPQNYYADTDVNSDDDGGWVNGLETRNEEIRVALLALAAELDNNATH
jgi:hypothetical protein